MDEAGVNADELEATGPMDIPAVAESVADDDARQEPSEPVETHVATESDEPQAERETETEPETAPQPDPEPDAEPPVESVPATLDEMVASIAADSGSTEPAADEVAQDSEAAPEPEAETAPEADVIAEASTESVAEAEPEPGSDAPEEAASELAAVAEAEPEPEPAEPKPLPYQLWTRLPLWLEFGAFVVFAGMIAYLLWSVPREALTTLPLYAALVFGGVVFVLIDLVTGLAIWLSARGRATDDEKAGLGRIIWTRALVWTAASVAVWWVAFLALDLHRIGVIG